MNTRLRELRKLAGYQTAMEFAEALGVPYTTYASWETNARGIPWNHAVAICDKLDCSLDELAGRKPVERTRYFAVNLDDEQTRELERFAGCLRQRGGEDEKD